MKAMANRSGERQGQRANAEHVGQRASIDAASIAREKLSSQLNEGASAQRTAGYQSLLNGGPSVAALQKKQDAANQGVKEDDEYKTAQRKVEMGQNESPRFTAPNHTGLPDQLKAGVENLSGVSLDGVKVHYNSDKPAQLAALAYTQGPNIYVGPGQEKHLPHETWHAAQQKQGRVWATAQMKGVPVNDDLGLEHEADVMGERAVSSSAYRSTMLSSGVALQTKPEVTFQRLAAQDDEEPQEEPLQARVLAENRAWATSEPGDSTQHPVQMVSLRRGKRKGRKPRSFYNERRKLKKRLRAQTARFTPDGPAGYFRIPSGVGKDKVVFKPLPGGTESVLMRGIRSNKKFVWWLNPFKTVSNFSYRGSSNADIAALDGMYTRSGGSTWHHCGDWSSGGTNGYGKSTMQLVPTNEHTGIKHHGGAWQAGYP